MHSNERIWTIIAGKRCNKVCKFCVPDSPLENSPVQLRLRSAGEKNIKKRSGLRTLNSCKTRRKTGRVAPTVLLKDEELLQLQPSRSLQKLIWKGSVPTSRASQRTFSKSMCLRCFCEIKENGMNNPNRHTNWWKLSPRRQRIITWPIYNLPCIWYINLLHSAAFNILKPSVSWGLFVSLCHWKSGPVWGHTSTPQHSPTESPGTTDLIISGSTFLCTSMCSRTTSVNKTPAMTTVIWLIQLPATLSTYGAEAIFACPACNVNDDEKKQHGPKERLESVNQGGNQCAQRTHKSHDPQCLHNTQEPRDTQKSQNPDAGTDPCLTRRFHHFNDDVDPWRHDNDRLSKTQHIS